ncbi:MAG: hypothetical protein IJU69_00905 [Bacteroidales bacterium]|nr:hypothetical protein [Bacteroidales bacterium]
MIRVACIGDSITWGFTVVDRRRNSYPAVLQSKLGPDYEVRNFGCNNAAARFDSDTPYVRQRAWRECRKWAPDIVLLMLGSNDTKARNWDPELFRKGYGSIVDSCRGLPSRPRVILIAPVRVFLKMGRPILGLRPEVMEEGVRPAIRETAAQKGLELIDLQDLFTDSSYMIDGVHPQREGARLLAEAIYEAVDWQSGF